MFFFTRPHLVAYKRVLSLIIGVLFLAPIFHIPSAQAAIPQTINYQSRLLTPTGDPVTVATPIQISFYKHPTNGNPADAQSQVGPLVWKETYDQAVGACSSITPDAKGYFFLKLGSCNPFPAYLDFSDTLYVAVVIGADAEALPRVQLSSHPYALNAQRVNSLQATTTAQANSLLALDSNLNFNIATGTFMGGGLNINGTSTLQSVAFTMATGTMLNLTTALAIGGIRLDSIGTSNITSGASLIGVFDEFDNSDATTVQGALRDLDLAITNVSSSRYGMTLQAVTDNGNTTTNRIQFNGATSTGYIDVVSYNGATAQITLDADDGSMSGGSAYLIMEGDGNGGGEAAIKMYSNGSSFGQLDGTVGNFRVIAVGGANLTFGTQSFGGHFFEATGRLGLGTSAPTSTLHVFDRSGTSATSLLTLQNTIGDYETFVTDADPNGLVMGNLGDIAVDATNGLLYMKQIGNGTNTGWFAFATGTQSGDLQSVTDAGNVTTNTIEFAGGTSTGSLSILGNLGVNTDATSTYAMHVYGGANFGEYLSMGNGKFKWGDEGDLTHIYANKDDGMIRVSSQSYIDIGDLNNGITGARMSMDGNNGYINFLNSNVGIGTNNPTRALEILSDSPVQTIWRNSSGEGVMMVNDNLGDEIGLSDIRTDGFIAAVSKADPALYYYARGVLNANFDTYRVGINTVAPTSMLDLVGGVYGDAILTLNADDGTASGRDAGIRINADYTNGGDAANIRFLANGMQTGQLFSSGGGESGFRVEGPNNFALYTNGQPRFIVDGAGGVAIGGVTADASAAFEVLDFNRGVLLPRMSAAQRDAVANPATGLVLYNNSSSTFDYFDGTSWVSMATGTGGAGALNLQQVTDNGNTTTNTIEFAGGTSTGQFIVNTMLGVGTNSPTRSLEVFSDSSILSAWRNTAGEGIIIANNNMADEVGISDIRSDAIIAAVSQSDVNLFYYANKALNVTQDTGRVGINTIAPAYMLDLQGGSFKDAVLNIDSDDGNGWGNEAGIIINSDNINGSDAAFIKFNNNGTHNAKLYGSTSGSGIDVAGDNPFVIGTNSWNRLTVAGNGQILIATSTTPVTDAMMVINSRNTFNALDLYTDLDPRGMSIGSDRQGGEFGWTYDGGNRLLIATRTGNDGNDYDFVDIADHAMTINSNAANGTYLGFVGINNYDPQHYLDVVGGNSWNAIASFSNASNGFHLYSTTGTPEGAVIGNVGDIAISPSNGAAFIKQSGSGTRNGWVSFATGTGSVGPLSLQQVTDIGNVTTRSIQFAGGTSTGQFIVTDKLGIGTASPSSMLHVLGGDAGDALLILDSVDGSGSGRDAGIVINADNLNGSDVPYIMMKTNGLQTAKVYSSPWGSGFDIQNDSYFNVITQGVERFRVNGDGHVGIATTTPRALLSVDGRTTDWRLFEASNNYDREGLGMGVDAWGGDMSLYYNSGNHLLVSTYFGNVGDNYDHVFLGDRRLTVRQASGFVGIGTEQPSNRLDVRGAISIASSTPATSDQALYNLGGVLYWDGSPLSIGGLLTMQDTANYSLATDGYVLFDTGAATYEDDGGMMNIAAKDGGYQASIGEAGGTRLNFQSQSGPPAEVLFLDARNVGDRRGIEYAGDYSEDFSVRSLVDKGFVMDYVASTTGGDLQQVTDNGNSTTNAIQFAGGTSTGKFVVNGRFGINTNNPSYAMDVNSEDSVQAIWRNSLGEGVAITNDYLGGEIGLLDARTDRIIAAASKSNLDLFHFGGRVLNVNADNFRAGINTATPSSLFHVQGGLVGDAILTVSSDDGTNDGRDAGIVINSDNGNGSDAAYIKFNNNGAPSGKLYSGLYESGLNIEGNKSFLFRTNNLERLNIGGDGRIGISTTTPQAILSIDGSVIGGNRMLEVSNQDDRRGVGFGIDAFGGDLGVYYDQGNHLMVSTYFGGAGNSYDHVFLGDRHLTVRQASGFVGIGTESPANRLHVMGGISIASSTPATPVNALYNLGGELWWNGVPITSASSLADVDGDTVVMVEKNPDDDTVRFLTVGEQRMYINNVGNVGIGVNNPLVSLLQVGPNAHEASTFSASGIPGVLNIANFRDENGENVFRAAGSVANNDLVVGFGDLDFGGTGTSIKVDYGNDSISLSNSQLRFYEQGSSGEYVGFISPASLAVSTVYTLPSQDGTDGQVLATDGAGILSWISASSSSSANLYNTDGSIPEVRTVTVDDGAEIRFADQNNAGNFIYLQTDYSANGNLKIGGVNDNEGGRNHFISFMDNLNMYSDGGIDLQASTNQIDLGGQFGHLEVGSANLFTDYHAPGSRFGLRYDADYSSDFVARSLVDKAYVDSLFSGSSGDHWSLNGNTNATSGSVLAAGTGNPINIGRTTDYDSWITLISGSAAPGSENPGGTLSFNSGHGDGSGNGGTMYFYAGEGGNTTGSGGDIFMSAGAASNDGNGGFLYLNAGSGSTNGYGGNVHLTAGNSGDTGLHGGDIIIKAGDSNNGLGGNVNVVPGFNPFGGGYGKTILGYDLNASQSAGQVFIGTTTKGWFRGALVVRGNDGSALDLNTADDLGGISIGSDLWGGEFGLSYNNSNRLMIGTRIGGGSNYDYVDFADRTVTINSAGRLNTNTAYFGINNNDPQYALDVNSGESWNPIASFNNLDSGFRLYSTTGTPEGAVIGNKGDMAVDPTNGVAYIKQSGLNTKTGWVSFATGTGAALSFQQVTDVGNVTSKAIQFAGGTSTGNFVVERASGIASITAHTPNDDAFIDIIGNGGASALRLSSNNGGNYSVIESASNGSFNLTANGNIVAWADASGNFGVGNNGPDVRLTVTETGNTVAAFDRLGDDGTLVSLRQDGVEEGTITISGNTVSYNAFTGSHYAWTDENIEKGMLVTLTGDNKHLHDNQGSEILYGVKTATSSNDSRIMGVYLALQEPSKAKGIDNPHLIMAAGNGELWVTDKGEDINIGDYLVSSEVAGHGQKDIGEFAISHVVARAAESIDWSDVTESVDGVKHKKISVFFDSFDKNNIHSSVLGSSLQGAENSLEVGDLTIGNALFRGKVTIQGLVTLGKDVVGQAKILAGDTKVRVDFADQYPSMPIITITPTQKVTVPYWVEGQSVKGFEIVLDGTQPNDLVFNWHAFGNDQGIIQSSDGSVMVIGSVAADSAEPEIVSASPSPSTPPAIEIDQPAEAEVDEPVVEIVDVPEPAVDEPMVETVDIVETEVADPVVEVEVMAEPEAVPEQEVVVVSEPSPAPVSEPIGASESSE